MEGGSKDKYTFVKVLGKGSFGAAWLVQRKSDGQKFVAKEIRFGKMSQQEKDSARQEVATLRSLSHPNIISYVDHFEEKTVSSLYIVMEYANGGDLKAKIDSRRGKLFSEAEILQLFVQLCLAIDHMHSKRMLHRDLKSQNVFLTQDGMIKLGDFGISTVLRNTHEMKKTMCGTPYYFSPELCRGERYNNKSDVWALGCILYELASLTHAFEANSMKGLVAKILKGVYPEISSTYSSNLRGLIKSMLNIDPKARPNVREIITLPYIKEFCSKFKMQVNAANREGKSIVNEEEKAKALKDAEERAKKLAEEREKMAQEKVLKNREMQARQMAQMEEERKIAEEKIRALQQRQQEANRLVAQRQLQMREEAAKKEKEREKERERERAERAIREKDREKEREKDRERNRLRDAEKERAWDKAMADAMRQREEERERERERYEPRQAPARGNELGGAPAAGGAAPRAPQTAQEIFWENRRQYEANRRRAEEAARAGGEPRPDPEAQAQAQARRTPPQQPASNPEPQQAKPKKQLTQEELAAAAREAHLQMRREAAANKRRLLGEVDPQRVTPPEEPPAQQQQARQRTPPSEPIRQSPVTQTPPGPSPASKPPAQQQASPAPPPPVPAVIRREELKVAVHPQIDDDDWNGPDMDEGVEAFINAEAAADQGANALDRSRQYNAFEAAIDQQLRAADAGNPRDQDFFDPEEEDDPGCFKLDGQTLQLPNCGSQNPLSYRIESLRMFLESAMGLDRFVRVYGLLSNADEQDDAVADAQKVLPPAHERYVPLVLQLLVCEDYLNRVTNGV
jgi:NIMA (never in mitosis gene a)-related kinase